MYGDTESLVKRKHIHIYFTCACTSNLNISMILLSLKQDINTQGLLELLFDFLNKSLFVIYNTFNSCFRRPVFILHIGMIHI